MRNKKELRDRIRTVENLHLFHFWPGHNLLLLSKMCSLNCLDCWPGLFGFKKSKCSSSTNHLRNLLRNPENVGIAVIYGGNNTQTILKQFKKTKKLDSKNVLITNGFLSRRDFNTLLPHIDALCLHLKAITVKNYVKLTGRPNGLKWALTTIRETLLRNIHLEVSYQLVPGINSSPSSIQKLVKTLKTYQKTIPLHLLRFYPNFIMQDRAPTRDRLIKNSWEIAKGSNLPFVYRDHLFQGKAKNTYINGKVRIKRRGDQVIPKNTSHYKKELNIEGIIRERRKP